MPDFEVKQDDLHATRIVERDDREPGDGEVRLRVDRFAFTANTLTYAALGHMLGYWKFFPASEPGWGRVPAWGYGDVEVSNVEGIAPGERFYGYFPMSSTLTVRAQPGGPGFVDASPHRAELPPVYNQYMNTKADRAYSEDHADALMLLRPLFITSVLLDDFLAEQRDFGAEAVVLASASSKTAYGLAFLLARRDGGPDVIGLTSAGNRAFVEELGLYDRVVTYDELDALPADAPLAFVDMAGNPRVRAGVHARATGLRASIAVGATHWDSGLSFEPEGDLPGPKPEFFFAPSQVDKVTKRRGPAGVQEAFAEAWSAFVGPASGWMTIERDAGPDAVARVFAAFADGAVNPRAGHVLSL